MTNEDIIRMAREAGFVFPETQEDSFTCWWEELERFAALVASHEREKWEQALPIAMDAMMLQEREACAKVCEEMWAGGYGPSAITAAIRARGEK